MSVGPGAHLARDQILDEVSRGGMGLAKLIAPLAGDALSDTTVAGDTDPGTVLGTVS